MEVLLKASEVAGLIGKSDRQVRRLADSGKIHCQRILNAQGIYVYMFPISSLPPEAQTEYYKRHSRTIQTTVEKKLGGRLKPAPAEALDHFTAAERQEISFWLKTVEDWQAYRNQYGDKAAADEAFVAQFKLDHAGVDISRQILYRRGRAVKDNNLRALTDSRGKARTGSSKIDDTLWQAFLSFYLDYRGLSVRECYRLTELWAEDDFPDLLPLPSYTTFYRHVTTDVQKAVATLAREGYKKMTDRCAPYIRREYENMESNDCWFADNHTFDVITEGDGGSRHRLYLTAFFDARSQIFVGAYVTEAPSSQATLIALRRAILKYGIPKQVWLDNGHEFTAFDVGGPGHHAKKSQRGQFAPPPIFQRLGIKVIHAKVRNARAKTIERAFLDVKNQISRLFETFCGGTVLEKPEMLKTKLKNGHVVLDGDFTASIETLLEGWFNEREYGGAVIEDRGKPCIEVWHDRLQEKRVPADEEQLNLMLMRSTRKQKVKREGVRLLIHGKPLWYYDMDFVLENQGKEVYLRYDPTSLKDVRVYTLEDKFICTLPAFDEVVLRYDASADAIGRAMAIQKRYEKAVKSALESKTAKIIDTYGKRDAFDLVLAKARRNQQARIVSQDDSDPKLVRLVYADEDMDETPLLRAANGENTIDYDKLLRNCAKNHGGAEE